MKYFKNKIVCVCVRVGQGRFFCFVFGRRQSHVLNSTYSCLEFGTIFPLASGTQPIITLPCPKIWKRTTYTLNSFFFVFSFGVFFFFFFCLNNYVLLIMNNFFPFWNFWSDGPTVSMTMKFHFNSCFLVQSSYEVPLISSYKMRISMIRTWICDFDEIDRFNLVDFDYDFTIN